MSAIDDGGKPRNIEPMPVRPNIFREESEPGVRGRGVVSAWSPPDHPRADDIARRLSMWESDRREERKMALLAGGIGFAFGLVTWDCWIMSKHAAFFFFGVVLSAGIAVGCGFRAVECMLAARELSRSIKVVLEDTRL